MLNPREYQTPNALDPGEAPPSRPSRRVPEPGDTLPSASSSFPAQKLPSAFQDSNYDNESYTVHDQLPSVEEARMYSARILQQNSQRDLGAGSTEAERARLTDSIPLNPLMRDVREQRKRRFVRLCCGLVGALAVVMVIVFVAVEAKSPSPSPAAPQTVASPPTPPPHVTDDPPTPQPTGISPRLQQALQFLSANSISNPESFLDKATPQYEAAAWMADQDLLKYEIPSSVQDQSTRFVQRYALVVFYLSMEGPRWRNQLQFLDKTDECSWFRTETLTDGTSVAVGVTCTENEEVENILMRKCAR